MKVLVVGAGPSGLVTLKELSEAGIDCTAVDDGPRIGGAFDNEREGSAVYDSTQLTTTNYFMAYSSLPPHLGERRRFWTHREYMDYLQRFARRFGLNDRIRFSTEVTRVELEGEQVRVGLESGDERWDELYDSVVMASGINRRPKFPDIPGLDSFTGTVHHAQGYRNASPFTGKRVLCIGLGETGADVAHEVVAVASDAMLSVRQYPAIIERYPGGDEHPGDALTARCLYALDMTTLALRFVNLHRGEMQNAERPFNRLLSEWNVRSRGRYGQWFTKNEAPLHDIAEGRLAVNVGGVSHVEASTVYFNDGTQFEADAIICNTGYNLEWPCPGLEFDDVQDLFKLAFHPDLSTRIVFIGWIRPDLGGVPTCAELQARYLALLLTGRRSLPNRADMLETIQRDREFLEARFCNSSHLATVVHYPTYCDDLARLIGCHPFEDGRILDPALLMRLWFGSLIGAQYRLVGPGADPELAHKTLMRLPIAWKPKTMATFGLRAALDRIPVLSDHLARRDARDLDASLEMFLAEHGGEVIPDGREHRARHR